jgi:hypothetical protein
MAILGVEPGSARIDMAAGNGDGGFVYERFDAAAGGGPGIFVCYKVNRPGNAVLRRKIVSYQAWKGFESAFFQNQTTSLVCGGETFGKGRYVFHEDKYTMPSKNVL